MRRRACEVAVVLCLLAAMFPADQAGGMLWREDLSLDVGLNYDWVGQRYRLVDDDTLDLFDEKSLSLAIGYREVLDSGLWGEDKFTLSDHALKNLFTAGWRGALSPDVQLKLRNDLEVKEYRWQGDELFGSGYWENRLRMEGIWPCRPGLRLGIEQRLTHVDYEKSTAYFRDYWLSESTARMELDLGLMWSWNVDYAFARRAVPDSSGMNYWSHSVTSSLDGLAGWAWQLAVAGQLERRSSATHEIRQDFVDLTGQVDLEYDLGLDFSLVFETDLEKMVYDHPDEVYYNYWSGTAKLGLCRDLSMMAELAVLPAYHRSRAEETTIGETYQEFGVEFELDYVGTGRFWASLSLEIGERVYDETQEESFYSGYFYLHPTLLFNYRLTDELSLDLMADHEPEWHRQEEDDFTTSLFSCSLNYRFR